MQIVNSSKQQVRKEQELPKALVLGATNSRIKDLVSDPARESDLPLVCQKQVQVEFNFLISQGRVLVCPRLVTHMEPVCHILVWGGET